MDRDFERLEFLLSVGRDPDDIEDEGSERNDLQKKTENLEFVFNSSTHLMRSELFGDDW